MITDNLILEDICQLLGCVAVSEWYYFGVLSESVHYDEDRVVVITRDRVLGARQLCDEVHRDVRPWCRWWLHCLRFSIFGVCAVFVLLAAYAILDELADFVAHVRKLVVSLDEFHCSCDARVSM